ncbi:hypothetical protein BGX31_006737 [Mortierella sp. GBA43]|nr:hypothetical protein BGX31_006737 [Mortierella sp. GBA43]
MADPTPDLSLDDHIAHQTTSLIRLLESIAFPYDISSQDIQAALTTHYLQPDPVSSGGAGATGQDPRANPAFKFVDWLIHNVSAESNWSGYQDRPPSPLGPQLSKSLSDIEQDDEDQSHGNVASEDLERECSQLQNTLLSLEKELADLKVLETHVTDTNKALDADLHHSSVQLDATASQLAETARASLLEYMAPGPSQDQTMDVDTDRDQAVLSSLSSSSSSSPSSSTKRFLYQCQKELLQIQRLDLEYLKTIDQLFQQILHHVSLTMDSSASTSAGGISLSHLDQLLKRDPAQDQELVRLCTTYRSTKMSHIRAMVQLKCIEEELQHMKELDAKYQALEEEEEMADQDTTADHTLYKSTSLRNHQIQQTRQQEIELISVQRETARLEEEMGQLLSDPVPTSTLQPATERGGGGGLSSSRGSSTRSLNGRTSLSHHEHYHSMETDTHEGALVDICERIARNDIELRFLSAAHRDYIRDQEQAIKDLEGLVDQLAEYYSLGVTVEQTLTLEKDAVQTQKSLLEAVIQECQGIRDSSRRLHELGKRVGPTTEGDNKMEGEEEEEEEETSGTRQGIELLEQLKQHDHLTMQTRQERQTLQENVRQMASVKDHFKRELLYRYSGTEEIHWTPKEVHEMKKTLVKQTQDLQQEYVDLSDRTKSIHVHGSV